MGCPDSIKLQLLFLNYSNWTIGTTWGYAGQLLNQYNHQTNTNMDEEWETHLLTVCGYDLTLVLSNGKISLGLHGKTINPFLMVLSRGTGNLLHNPGWPIYIGSSTKGLKCPRQTCKGQLRKKKEKKKKPEENTSKELFCGLGYISILLILKFLKRHSRSESSKLEGQVRPTALNGSDSWRFVSPSRPPS